MCVLAKVDGVRIWRRESSVCLEADSRCVLEGAQWWLVAGGG